VVIDGKGWVFGAWLAVHAVVLGYGAASGRWPLWRMFAHPIGERRHYVLEARTSEGDWEPLPLYDLFPYHEGFTTLTVLDGAPALSGRGGKRERRALAQWAVDTLAPGVPYVEARLRMEAVRTRSGRLREEDLGTFPLATRDAP
jgi:hypothetical protein